MSAPSTHDYQVVIVGYGPSGAVAASLLGSRGLRVLVVDRATGIYEKPRAIAIDHEIMRLLDNLGVAGQVLPHVAPFPASQHFGAEGQLIRRIDMVAEPYPQGYTPTMVFTQPPVEAALRAHAESYPSVTVELGVALVGLEPSPEGVRLDLRHEDGRARFVTADYVVACDGASSGVRGALGIALDDLVFDEPWLVVDVKVGHEALARLPQTAAQYCNPARPTSYIIGPGNHRRWEIMLLPGEDGRAMERPEEVWRLLSPWLTPEEATLWRSASYRFHALVAHEWRRGRVFLAGDAAHQQPPFLGQGMCQGLRDVSNLTWKLAGVIADEAPDNLLDTYGEERGAHVRELTSRIKAIGHVICERDPAAARARDARILAEGGGVPRTLTRQEIVPPLERGLLAVGTPGAGLLFPQPWIESDGGAALMDRVAGAGWRLVVLGASGLGEAIAPASLGLTPIRIVAADPRDGELVERDGVLAGWFAKQGAAAAIVRPDHYVYGTAATESDLRALLAGLARRLAPEPAGPTPRPEVQASPALSH